MTAQEVVHCNCLRFGDRVVGRTPTGRRIEVVDGIAAGHSCRSRCCRKLEVVAFRRSSLGKTSWYLVGGVYFRESSDAMKVLKNGGKG